MHGADFVLIHPDPHRTIRSLAAQHGFHDPEHRGELAQIFDGRGRALRFLRSAGVSLDRFGEILADRGVTSRRLSPAEVADLLSATFDSRPQAKVAKPPTASALLRAEEKARTMRNRKFCCPECGQIARGTRNSVLICGVTYEMTGRVVTMLRVDPLPEEIAVIAAAGGSFA
jgi:hypothetical protein